MAELALVVEDVWMASTVGLPSATAPPPLGSGEERRPRALPQRHSKRLVGCTNTSSPVQISWFLLPFRNAHDRGNSSVIGCVAVVILK